MDNIPKCHDWPDAPGCQETADLEYTMRFDDIGRPYGDYVFGRMMKMGVSFNGKTVDLSEREVRSDYQAWCRKYRTYEALADAAERSLKG